MKKIFIFILLFFSFAQLVHGDINWSSPTQISLGTEDASDPSVVMDVYGNGAAIWVENNTIKTSYLPYGGTWSNPIDLSNSINLASDPRLSVDGGGNLTALWLEKNKVHSSYRPFLGNWGVAIPLSGPGAISPCLEVDPFGNAVALWQRSGYIESSTRLMGNWSLVSILSIENSDHPDLTINNSGTAVAAWHTHNEDLDIICTNSLNVKSNTWSSGKIAIDSSIGFKVDYPKVAVDSNNNASLSCYAFKEVNGSFQNVKVINTNLAENTADWESPIVLSNEGLRDPADLNIKLLFDKYDNLISAWTNSYDGETFNIESSQKFNGESWTPSISPQTSTLHSFAFDLKVAESTALLTNMAWDGFSTLMIDTQQLDTANPLLQGWTIPKTLSLIDWNGYPRCALSQSWGNIHAATVWIAYNGQNNVIYASKGYDRIVTPPANVSAVQDVISYGVFDNFINIITWDASPDANVIQYNIYRDDQFIGSVDAQTFQFIDNNQAENATVKYGVAAMTSDLRQSAIISYIINP